MKLKSIKKAKNLSGARVLVRVDFNVPIKQGRVSDTMRIEAVLPTIEFLVKKKAKVILVSHLGRPKGVDKSHSLKPVAVSLSKLLGQKVKVLPLKVIKKPRQIKLKDGAVVMLENIRFLPDEAKNIGTLAQDLAALGDIFVQECFGVAHRASASVVGVAKYLPSYAGFLLGQEIKVLAKVIKRPKRPLVVLLGGAKLETKIPVLKNLLPIADYILVAGGIANTCWWAAGLKVGSSLVNKNFKKEIKAACADKTVIVPVDVVVGNRAGNNVRIINTKKKFTLKKDEAIYDIGPETVKLFAKHIKKAKTLIWNGAMGMFEQHPYEFGTNSIADLVAARSKGRALGVAGGGETVEVLRARDIFDQLDLVSTGGGAMLEFLSGKKLPGIEALRH